jgi:hypothetical protein
LRDTGAFTAVSPSGEVVGDGAGVVVGDRGEDNVLASDRGEFSGEPGWEVRGDPIGESVGDDEMANGDEARGGCSAAAEKCCLRLATPDVGVSEGDERSGVLLAL